MPENSALQIPHSPIAALGTITILIAFVVAAYAGAAGIVGNSQRRRRLVTSAIAAQHAFTALMMLASALMMYAFITHDYTIKYVFLNSDVSMPLIYKLSGYWSGLDGSIMFWVAVLAVFASIAVHQNARRHSDMMGYVVGVIMVVQVFFLAIIIYNKNPFATWLTEPPVDGKGMNPLLQTYWMIIHPPALYIGYVAATIPFAFGIAALASGRLDDQWLNSVRSWMLVCFFFLSFGLILGGRWAYEELGWGGYWAWDPVENAGLLPWFTATAFLHSLIIQEQRGMLRVWNMFLVIITFILTIVGTAMTRAGWAQSVHSFGEDATLSLLFTLFLAFTSVIAFGLLIFRLPRLRAVHALESFLSREFAFLLNNWILLICAIFTFFGTMLPVFSEAFRGEEVVIGPPFFNKAMILMGLILLFLAGAAPLLAWRRTSSKRLWQQFKLPVIAMVVTTVTLAFAYPQTRVLTDILWPLKFEGKVFFELRLPCALINFGLVAFTVASIVQEFVGGVRVRKKQTGSDAMTSLLGIVLAKRRKYGGYIVHLGIAIMFVGFAGKAFDSEENFTLKQGESRPIRDYTVTYLGLEVDDTESDWVTRVLTTVRLERDGEELDILKPEKRAYRKHEQGTHEIDLHWGLAEDFYLVFNGYDPDSKEANFTAYVNPHILWVWAGFTVLFFGTLLLLLAQSWIDRLIPTRRTRIGRAGDVVALLVIVGGVTFGTVRIAVAQPANPAMEHDDSSAHQTGPTAAGLNRANDPAFLGPIRAKAALQIKSEKPNLAESDPTFKAAVDERVAPVVSMVKGLFAELTCLCGGCSRENLRECRCGYAAQERGEVLELLSRHDLLSEEGRDRAYKDVVDALIAKYEAKKKGQGKKVLMMPPKESMVAAWIPYGLLIGGLVFLIFAGRRWVRHGKRVIQSSASTATDTGTEDEPYADLLDDELRDTD